MTRIECSIWNNGGTGWGLKVLGGLRAREAHFRRNQSPILVEAGSAPFQVNIDKDSFWTETCGELISIALREWIMQVGLTTGDRVWLEVVEPHRRFKVARSPLPAKEAAQ
jgi:hypothetical protein